MSRFDVMKFSPPPDQELICGICMHILDMPKESPCRHVFCKVCIKQALKEKSKCPICRTPFREYQLKDVLPLVQNMLNKLTMHCDNFDNGCKELVPMERFLNHVASCDYVMVTCKFSKCGKSLLKINQDDHEKKECIYRDTLCTEGCGLSIPWKDRETHKCMDALLSLKDELTTKNKLLESKIEDLNSVISALNSKLQEFESKNSKTELQKTESNQEETIDTSPLSESEIYSPIHSISSIYDDYEDYHSEPYSETSFDDYCPDNEEVGFVDFDAEYAADDIDENPARDEEWSISGIEPHVSGSPRFDHDDVYHYDPEVAASEQVETTRDPTHSAQASAVVSVPGGAGGSETGGEGVSSRKRFHVGTTDETNQNKKLRSACDDGYHETEVESDPAVVRRSRRLQNRDPSPASEIPCVEVPPSASYLLDAYANNIDSSDDDWSPSHFL